MMNTAETAKRHYETENRENHTERKKFSNAMAMILGILVTVEIMILGAMVMKIDVHSADWIAMALAFVVVYSGVVAADRKSTRLNSSHKTESRMPSSA